jgi:hypothetical protein
MNPNAQQAVEAENAGEEKAKEDIDYVALYGGHSAEVDDYTPSKETQHSFAETMKDIAKQAGKNLLIGVGGAYGDLSDLAGLTRGTTPGQEEKLGREGDILQKLQQPGYQPSMSELQELGGDDEFAPPMANFPTSETIKQGIEAFGGPGEAETTAGRYAGRAGKIVGSGAALGAINPTGIAAGTAAGIAGQGVEEMGGGPLAQTAAEIVTLIATHGRTGKSSLSSGKKVIQEKIENLRNLGYPDEQITLAINSANKGGKATKIASKSEKTKQAFEDFAEHSDDIVSGIIENQIPGAKKGAQEVHALASEAYGEMAKKASNIMIHNSKPFEESIRSVMTDVSKNLGNSPEAKGFLSRLMEAQKATKKNPSAENFMNFYKELNGMGKWMNRNQKDRLLTQVKNGIKDTFKANGKTGKAFAEDFEKANLGIQKAYKAEEVMNTLQKVKTDGKTDFKKLSKVFDDPEDVKLFGDVLGTEQAKNLKLIAKTGKEVKDFDKAWKTYEGFHMAKNILLGGDAFRSIVSGNFEHLMHLGAGKITEIGARKLAEKALTDPKFQRIQLKALHALAKSSPQGLRSAHEAMEKYLKDENIGIPAD